jgi:hypothetical protein
VRKEGQIRNEETARNILADNRVDQLLLGGAMQQEMEPAG